MTIDVPKQKKKAMICPVMRCKRLAWEEVAVDNNRWYFCPKHGAVKKVENNEED